MTKTSRPSLSSWVCTPCHAHEWAVEELEHVSGPWCAGARDERLVVRLVMEPVAVVPPALPLDADW